MRYQSKNGEIGQTEDEESEGGGKVYPFDRLRVTGGKGWIPESSSGMTEGKEDKIPHVRSE